MNDKPFLFLYWENPPDKMMPAYIALCRVVIEYHCSDMNIQIIGPDNIHHWLPDLPPRINDVTCTSNPDKISLAIKTGFIRIFLLEKYGGIYLDSDSIPLKTLSFLWEICKKGGFTALRRSTAPTKHIANNLLACTPENDIIKQIAAVLREKITQKISFEWGEIGAYTLTPIVDAHLNKCTIIPEHQAHPIVSENVYLFMSETLEPENILYNDTFNVMLFHKPFHGPSPAIPEYGIEADKNGWLNTWDIDRLYYGNILLSKIFRKAIPEKIFIDKYENIIKLMKKE